MIRSVKITNKNGDSIDLELGNPWRTGLNVRNITGLGPIKADINIANLAVGDGGVYNSSRANTRNIVFTLGLLPTPTVQDARRLTYRYFPIKEKIDIEIDTGDRRYKTSGYVESNTPDIFQKDEITTISVLCPNPWFIEVNEQHGSIDGMHHIDFYNMSGGFEFPFSNEHPTQPKLFFGDLSMDREKVVVYNGQVSTGIVIELQFYGAVDNPIVYNDTTKTVMIFNTEKLNKMTGKGFKTGDSIRIDTRYGTKSIILDRDGKKRNVLNILDQGSSWITLRNGENKISYSATSGVENMSLRILYSVLYQGV